MAEGKGKGIRHWNDHIEKVINDKREAFKKFLSTQKMNIKMRGL
jgi:hypothetical protein